MHVHGSNPELGNGERQILVDMPDSLAETASFWLNGTLSQEKTKSRIDRGGYLTSSSGDFCVHMHTQIHIHKCSHRTILPGPLRDAN